MALKQKFSNKNFLIVEDDDISSEVTNIFLRRMSGKQKITTTIVETGEAAIEKVKENNFDLIIMDFHLPGMNGEETSYEIKKINPNIPIISLTADTYTKLDKLKTGIADTIFKPVDFNSFTNIVTKNLL